MQVGQSFQAPYVVPPPSTRVKSAGNAPQSKTSEAWWRSLLPEDSDLWIGDAFSAEPPMAKPCDGGDDGKVASQQLVALEMLAGVLGCQVTEMMQSSLQQSLLAQATKLLYAILGFACEGNCPNMLRNGALSRACHSPIWYGFKPLDLLPQWFNFPALLNIFGDAPMRQAYDAAQKCVRAQFVCALARAETLEVTRQSNGKPRAPWAVILFWFPEIGMVRSLHRYIRRRCWEDPRDRSRSRSRSRERKKSDQKHSQHQRKPSSAVRFFIKGCGPLETVHLQQYFSKFGAVSECSLIRDKKSKKSRGMAFVGMEPAGVYKGVPNNKEMVKQWVLGTAHIVHGFQLEVTEAEGNTAEDVERKREQRVEERRVQREKQEGAAGNASSDNLVLSPWAKRWRDEIRATLPKDVQGPAPWSNPGIRALCYVLWTEAAEYVERVGGQEAREALALFRAEGGAVSEGPSQWAFVPGADVLLTVGEGLVGVTAEGVFLCEGQQQGPAPGLAPGSDLLATLIANPSQLVPHAPPQGNLAATAPAKKVGFGDQEKIFVGGLTPSTTLEMLTRYFSKYGSIVDSVVMMDKLTGKPRGFGFVVFEHSSFVEEVMNDYKDHRVDGKWVEVKRATRQEQPAPAPAPAPQMVAPVQMSTGGAPAGMRPPPPMVAQPQMVQPPQGLQPPPPPHRPTFQEAPGGLPSASFSQSAPNTEASIASSQGLFAGFVAPVRPTGEETHEYDPFA